MSTARFGLHRAAVTISSISSVSILLLGALTARAEGADRARVASPVRSWTAADLERFDPAWIHLKFVEGSDPVIDGLEFSATNEAFGEVNAQLAPSRVRSLRPSFPVSRDEARRWKAIGESRSSSVGPDLSLWFDLEVEGGRPGVARALDRLMRCPNVEIAHPAPIVETASVPAVGATVEARAMRTSAPLRAESLTPDFAPFQGYLGDTPIGLDAPSAWGLPGGRGEGVRFIDVELCWTEDHEDFDGDRRFHIGGSAQTPSYEPHGTAVLGEIIGRHNGFGVDGFAPEVEWGVVAVTEAEWPTVAHRFFEAMTLLSLGDCWLIELQMYPPGHDATPMEYLQINFDVIWTSSWALGVVCVEAGANGSQNLDDPSWGGAFDRTIRDSGAILVAAGHPQNRVAEWFSNWGSRIDLHAWGSQIVTTGYGDLYTGGTLQTRYSAGFSGTSGASPMIAGSVLCLQGIARAGAGEPLSPEGVRALLSATGTASLDPTREIGPRPDLAAASVAILDPSGVGDLGSARPRHLLHASPNPFRDSIELRWTAEMAQSGTVVIFDASGRIVRRLGAEAGGSELRTLRWDGLDGRGRPVANGVYLAKLHARTGDRELRIVRVR